MGGRPETAALSAPRTVAAIAVATGLALWLATSVVGKMQLTGPEIPRIIPAADAPAPANPGSEINPSTAAPANNLVNPGSNGSPANAPPGSTPAAQPAQPAGASGPVLPERPQRIYGDMPIDPPLVNPNPRPAEE